MSALIDEDAENSYVIALSKRQHIEVMEQLEQLVLQLKALYLVPITLAFIGVTGAFLWFDKIPMWAWMLMNLILMTPYFGEGVKMILPLMTKTRNGP